MNEEKKELNKTLCSIIAYEISSFPYGDECCIASEKTGLKVGDIIILDCIGLNSRKLYVKEVRPDLSEFLRGSRSRRCDIAFQSYDNQDGPNSANVTLVCNRISGEEY